MEKYPTITIDTNNGITKAGIVMVILVNLL
jgi:hypothetical protein